MAEPVWFHIDVNSAFLSWTAAYRTLVEGRTPDLREIPSVIRMKFQKKCGEELLSKMAR